MNSVRRAVLIVAAAVLALPLIGAPAAADTPVRIGVSVPALGMLTLYVAEAQGFLKAEGLTPEIVTFQNGPAAAQAITAGAVDVNVADIFLVIDSYLAGRDLTAIWSVSNEPAYTWYGQAKDKSIADIKGGKVGVSSLNAMSYYLTIWALDKSGLDGKKDVNFIALGGPMSRVAGLQAGQVDLIPASPPGTFQLEEAGFKPLLDLASLLPESSDEVLYARKSTLDKNGDTLRKVIHAMVLAHHWSQTHHEETAKILLKYLGGKDSDLPYFVKTVEHAMPYYPDDGHFPDAAIDVFLGFYKDQGKLKELPKHGAFIDYRFIDYFKQHPIN